jgi:hypothetical protein
MVVSFDKFERLETPQIVLCNPGSKIVSGNPTNVIGELPNVTDMQIVMNFNAKSTLNFRIYNYEYGNSGEDKYIKDIFEATQACRYLYVPNIGFFIIKSAPDVYSNGMQYKEVSAESVEAELENRNMMYFVDGSYRLWIDTDDPATGVTESDVGILNEVLGAYSSWSVAHVDDVVQERRRYMKEFPDDVNVFTFFTENLQETFECIMVFNPLLRTISVYDKSTYSSRDDVKTDIHLTRNDWINEIKIVDEFDNTYTALNVKNEDGEGIASVNPLGTNVIYNFSHFLSWMTPTLAQKVSVWQGNIDSVWLTYYNRSKSYYRNYEDYLEYQQESDRLQALIDIYNDCKGNMTATGNTDSIYTYNKAITASGGTAIDITSSVADAIAQINSLISDTQDEKDDVDADKDASYLAMSEDSATLSAIRTSVSFNTVFTADERAELACYIYEGNLIDQYAKFPDDAMETAKIDGRTEMLGRARVKLREIANTSRSFEIDTESFLFIKDFAHWSRQLATGCLINIEVDAGEMSEVFLTSIDVSYEDRKVVLSFGNRVERQDAKYLFDNVFKDISRSANSVVRG